MRYENFCSFDIVVFWCIAASQVSVNWFYSNGPPLSLFKTKIGNSTSVFTFSVFGEGTVCRVSLSTFMSKKDFNSCLHFLTFELKTNVFSISTLNSPSLSNNKSSIYSFNFIISAFCSFRVSKKELVSTRDSFVSLYLTTSSTSPSIFLLTLLILLRLLRLSLLTSSMFNFSDIFPVNYD